MTRSGRSCLILCLAALFFIVMPAQILASSQPAELVIHTVIPGDTLGVLAEHYGVTVEDLVSANQIADPDLIHVGEELLVPGGEWSPETLLPAPITSLTFSTATPRQGRTLWVRIEASEPITVTGQFDERPMQWASEGPQGNQGGTCRYWSLSGVHPMDPTGPTPIEIRVSDNLGEEHNLSYELMVLAGKFGLENIVLSGETSTLLDPDILAREWALLGEVLQSSTIAPLSSAAFEVPVHSMWPESSPFGQRRSYNGGPTTSYHSGIDYSAKSGALVLAPAAGQVVLARSLDVRGNAIVIDHGAGLHSGYWHLSALLITEGDAVEKGVPLGRVGSTGLSTGPHLHWEVRVGAVAVDPLQWVNTDLIGEARGQ